MHDCEVHSCQRNDPAEVSRSLHANNATESQFLVSFLCCRIDSSVDPCDNFYDFACGAFIEQSYPADESVALDTFTLLNDNIQSQVFSLLNDDNSHENSTATFKLAKKYLQTCLERNGESLNCFEVEKHSVHVRSELCLHRTQIARVT